MTWMLGLAFQLWSIDNLGLAWKAAIAVWFVLAVAASSSLAHGLFATSLKRVTWAADGTWQLCDGQGREWSAALTGSSRHWGSITILVWKVGPRRWWAILTAASADAGHYRRLSVRWRLQRHA